MDFGEPSGVGEKTVGGGKRAEGWHVLWPKLFSKKYLFTKITLLSMIPWLLFLPVEPWMPQQSELHELVGKPLLDPAKPGELFGTTFSVGDETLHCVFTSRSAGFNGCEFLKDSLSGEKSVRATYFLMKTHYGRSSKMLNSLEQDGRELASPEELYRIRLGSFEEEKEFSIGIGTVFFLWLILVWGAERRKARVAGEPENSLTKPAMNKKRIFRWQDFPASLFSRDRICIKLSFLLIVLLLSFLVPTEPWVPDKSELHELVGKPMLDLRTDEFSVNDVTLHCIFRFWGGTNGCDDYMDSVSGEKPVRVTYFPMKTRFGKPSMMLNSLEQDGQTVVSSADLMKKREIFFGEEKELFKMIVFSFFAIWFMVFIIWKDVGRKEAIEEEVPYFGWQTVSATLFSRQFRGFRGVVISLTALWILTAPVEPRMPDESEVHELVGKAKFKPFTTKSESGVHFTVNDVLLHCSLIGSGGANGCDQYERLISSKKPVRATYVWVTTSYWVNYPMLNTLEQGGRMLVSPEESYRDRQISYNASKETEAIMGIVYCLIALLLWERDRRGNARKTST